MRRPLGQMRVPPSAAEAERARQMVHASPSVRAILKAHRCVNDIDVLVAFQRIQAGRYDDVARKANNPELKRKQSARAELGFTKAKAKSQALNELLDDARTQQPRIDAMFMSPVVTMPHGNASSTSGQERASGRCVALGLHILTGLHASPCHALL